MYKCTKICCLSFQKEPEPEPEAAVNIITLITNTITNNNIFDKCLDFVWHTAQSIIDMGVSENSISTNRFNNSLLHGFCLCLEKQDIIYLYSGG